MNDWIEVPLGQLLVTADSGFASGAHDKMGVPQVRMNNVEPDGNWNWKKIRRIPSGDVKDRYFLELGDVLFNTTNSPQLVGKSACFVGFSERVVFSNHFLRLRVDTGRLDPRFLTRWLHIQWRSRLFETRCRQWVNQAAYGKEDLLSLVIALPPLSEQKRIADILDKADSIRRQRKDAIALTEEFLCSAFLELFGDPGVNAYGWPTVLMDTLIDDTQYGTSVKANEVGRGLPILRMNNLTSTGGLNLDSLKWVELPETEIHKWTVRRGDLLFNRTNSPDLVGKTAIWPYDEPYALAGYLVRVRFNPDVALPDYVSGFLNSSYGKRYLFVKAKASNNMSNFSASALRRIPIPRPPLDLQRKFAQIVESTRETRVSLEASAGRSTALFNSLVQCAFRGEL